MDSNYHFVFLCIFVTILADGVFSQQVNSTGCVTNNWRKKWKSCYMKHCGTNPGTCITRGNAQPVCRRVKDNCGMCVKRWFVDNKVVECERTTPGRECPPNIILRNCPTNLCNNICSDSRFTGASCRVNRCGDCTPEYFVEGLWVMCPTDPFSPFATNNDLTGLNFFHPAAAGAVMTGSSLPSGANSNRNVGVPEIARAVAGSTSFRSAGPGDVAEPTKCSKGITERICRDLCSNQRCDNYPEAVCRVNNCGRCRAEFYIGDERVNCQGQKCPPGVTYFHTCDSCAYNYCHNYPKATCRMDACGKCKATFWINGNKQVKCLEQNIIDPCPDNVSQRWTCKKSPCHFDTCPTNSSISCITDNCGGCKPKYIHKLTKEEVQCRGYWTRFEGKGTPKGHVATDEEKRRARAERDRELRHSQIASGNTGSPDAPSTPEILPQRRPGGSGPNRNRQRGFVDRRPGQSQGQFDPIDLSQLGPVSGRPRPGSSSSNNNQEQAMFDIISQLETPIGGSSSSSASQRTFSNSNRGRPSATSGREASRSSSARNQPTPEQLLPGGWPVNNDPLSDILRGSDLLDQGPPSGLSRPFSRQSESSGQFGNSRTQNAQRMVPVVNNVLTDQEVRANNLGSIDSFPIAPESSLNTGTPDQLQPNIPVQPIQGNRRGNNQAVAEIDRIIENLDTALRRAHPPRDRSKSPASRRTLAHQKQSNIKTPTPAEPVIVKPVIVVAEKIPAKLPTEKKSPSLPLSSNTTKKPPLHKTKSKSASKKSQPKPRRNPDRKVKNAKRKEAAAAAAAAAKKKTPSKPERVPFQSLMFPSEFLNFFQSLSEGGAFAIPNQMLETTTKRR